MANKDIIDTICAYTELSSKNIDTAIYVISVLNLIISTPITERDTTKCPAEFLHIIRQERKQISYSPTIVRQTTFILI